MIFNMERHRSLNTARYFGKISGGIIQAKTTSANCEREWNLKIVEPTNPTESQKSM